MIKLSKLTSTQERITRETTAPFIIIDEDGSQRTEQLRVQYYSLSVAEGKRYREELGAAEPYWSEVLYPILKALPDIVDDDGNPVTITKELLEQINGINLQAIVTAIREDANPKSPGTK